MYNFDAKLVKKELIDWVREWFNQNGPTSPAVIGISGGKDSSVVAALCVEALGKDRVIGVLMPCGEQSDINYSKELVEHLGIKSYEINIESTYKAMIDSLSCDEFDVSVQAMINLPARIRMTTLYAVSQCHNGRVSNNCNLSENWVGYSTRFGDDAGDFSPLHNLTVEEVKDLGMELELPEKFIEKVPSDGLCGKTDEDNLGFTYETLDRYIREGVCDDLNSKQRIDKLHEQNKFKLLPIASFPYGYVKSNF